MNLILSALYGTGAGVIAILLHQTLPPLGVIAGIVLTYLVIWLMGRRFGARRYKVFALLGWVAIIIRAASFGSGQELLVQADSVGTARVS